jgi:hypothetical protein
MLNLWLVVSNMFYFPFHIWDVILPIDELIFFKTVKTTNQMGFLGILNTAHGAMGGAWRIPLL